jgi:hypothetical protein
MYWDYQPKESPFVETNSRYIADNIGAASCQQQHLKRTMA